MTVVYEQIYTFLKTQFSQNFLITYFYDLILLVFSISVLFKNIFEKDKILQRRLRLN